MLRYKVISGTVTELFGKTAEPLVGVNVNLVNNQNRSLGGGITNLNGQYNVKIPEGEKDLTIVYSYIGMKTKRIKYTGQTLLNVTLESESMAVDEVLLISLALLPDEVHSVSSLAPVHGPGVRYTFNEVSCNKSFASSRSVVSLYAKRSNSSCTPIRSFLKLKLYKSGSTGTFHPPSHHQILQSADCQYIRDGAGCFSGNHDWPDIGWQQPECGHQISDDDYGYHLHGFHAITDDYYFTGFPKVI